MQPCSICHAFSPTLAAHKPCCNRLQLSTRARHPIHHRKGHSTQSSPLTHLLDVIPLPGFPRRPRHVLGARVAARQRLICSCGVFADLLRTGSAMLRGAWHFAVAALQATRTPSGSRCATSQPDFSFAHSASRCTRVQSFQGLLAGGQQLVPTPPGRPKFLLEAAAQLLLHGSGTTNNLPSFHRTSLQHAHHRLPRGFCSAPASGGAVREVRMMQTAAQGR